VKEDEEEEIRYIEEVKMSSINLNY